MTCFMTHALECRSSFLFEERTEAYIKYAEGVLEKKMNSCAKSSRGANCSAGRQARELGGS